MTDLKQCLQTYFGFEEFRPGQEVAIRRALARQHTLLVMPTGAGKSLAYQLPAQLLPDLTLVISPLIALMKDQVDRLVAAGMSATFLNSGLPAPEANRRLRAVREGQVKLLYIAPERLRSRQFTAALAKTRVSLLAVDEAHCISQWGHDFRPDYLQLGPTWQAMNRPPLLATTATATPNVQRHILASLDVPQPRTIITGFNRPNLSYRVAYTPDQASKLQALTGLLAEIEGSAIIYTATRRNADAVADFVRQLAGRAAQAYHAGLEPNVRQQVQHEFMSGRLPIVVATNAFGMGVDKPDIRIVIHYNLPATVEAYYQEAGRAGRDGAPADCVLLFAPEDQGLQEWLIQADSPDRDDLVQMYQRLANRASGGEVYVQLTQLAQSSGLHPVKLRVTLSELERAGALFHMGDQGRYTQWRLADLRPEALERQMEGIRARCQRRQQLLAQMVRYAQSSECRRHFLLAYFGDESPPEVDGADCCDNHARGHAVDSLPRAETPEQWVPLVVLETVRSLERPVGRQRLAQILAGSKAKAITGLGYQRHRFYGKLLHLGQRRAVAIIDALVRARYLRLSGGRWPTLALTDPGRQALEMRAALPLEISDASDRGSVAIEWQQRTLRTPTVMATFKLFREGKATAEIAAQRELSLSTINQHLAKLIGAGEIEVQEVVSKEVMERIEGVLPAENAEAVGLREIFELVNPTPPPGENAQPQISYDAIRCVLAARAFTRPK